MIAVSDTGIGMDEEVQRHIFEPLFTTKPAGCGTGLGLSTVFGVVQQSGGHIAVYSEPGRGSTFRLYLPRRGDAVTSSLAPKPALTSTRGSETVLVVDDQFSIRRIAVKLLSHQGYRLLDAANGDEALALCERHSGPIHVLLTDVVMPGMSGRELAERLKRSRPRIKVLYMSGYTESALSNIPEIEAGLHYIAKPFEPEDLASRVREVLGERADKGTVLVVDDEAPVRKVLRKMLESAGYSVLDAANGREALQRVRQRAVDVMITDLAMPEKAGVDTIRELRSFSPAVRVIAISGASQGRFLKTAALAGAQATLTKPVAPDELLRIVERLIADKA